jgi:hypothetical protein
MSAVNDTVYKVTKITESNVLCWFISFHSSLFTQILVGILVEINVTPLNLRLQEPTSERTLILFFKT